MSSSENPINISISSSRDAEKDSKYNEFKEYIIKSNIDLVKQINDLRIEMNKLEQELSEKEKEEDKYDSRTRYMRGLITNLNELKKGYQEIAEHRKYLLNKADDIWSIMNRKSYNYNIKTIIYSVVILYFNNLHNLITVFNNYYLEKLFYFIVNVILFYNVTNIYIDYNKNIKNSEDHIKQCREDFYAIYAKKEKELIKLDESTLSLENWIYEV